MCVFIVGQCCSSLCLLLNLTPLWIKIIPSHPFPSHPFPSHQHLSSCNWDSLVDMSKFLCGKQTNFNVRNTLPIMNFWKMVHGNQAGWADLYFHASHLKRTHHLHQVAALALARLELQAFEQLMKYGEDRSTWELNMKKKIPIFLFLAIDSGILITVIDFCLPTQRERNTSKSMCSACEGWFLGWWFAFDHPNYSRWVALHIFLKTSRQFSPIPLDQAHEQHNVMVKGSGEAVGLIEKSIAFNAWMVAGPEQAWPVMDFQKQFGENIGEKA